MENIMTTDINKEEEYQFPNQQEYMVDSSNNDTEDSTDQVSANASEADDESVISVNKGGVLSDVLQKVINSPFMQNKRMLAIAGLAIVAILAVSTFKHHHAQSNVVQQPSPSAAHVMVPTSVVAPKSVLQNKITSNQHAVEQLNNQIRQLTTVVNSLQAQQANTARLIQPLQAELSHTNTVVTKMIDAQQAKKHPNQVVYYIKAMVPGRAWLVSQHGATASVGVGETLKGYGKILSINDNDGIVTTRSGRNIVYGHNDN